MKLKNVIAVTLVAILFTTMNEGYAQCKSFTKKKCIPSLSPYIHNGQMNSTTIFTGESAELMLTFYSGQDYRILICGQELLGDVFFKVKDMNNNTLFNSKAMKNSFWDFNVTATQQLIVEVIVPENEAINELAQSGCLSVLVGFRE